MESKEDFQIFPWSSFQEFKSVANIVLNLEFDSNLLEHIDFLKDLQWTERQLVIWRTKTTSAQHLYEIDATHAIVNCLLHEYLPKIGRLARENGKEGSKENSDRRADQNDPEPMNADDHMDDTDLNEQTGQRMPVDTHVPELNTIIGSSTFNLINEETISCLYSNAILKFFKMISYYDVIDGKIERLLSRSEANLVRICEKLDFPQYIIEYRHRIAHNKVPSFEQLRTACEIALSWMKRNYWSRYVYLLDSQEKAKQQIYEQTTMVLSSLFEREEDNLDRLNSRLNSQVNKSDNERPSKRQKVVESKKFNVLDRKQVGLLNDTLYDMLNDDFYTTLHAVTLYIVDSTKEHLDRLTAEQMRKWIDDDAAAMSLAFGGHSGGQSNGEATEEQSGTQPSTEKRKREQLIPAHILASFKPIFEIINRQLSSINQLLFYLHEIVEDQKMHLKTSAQAWFVQIVCSLLNNLNYSTWLQNNPNVSKQDKNRPTLTEFERCFRLSDVQLNDLKWVHLFIRLVEEPVMNQINLSLVKRIYPLVSFRYPKGKFNQICELLTIYLDGGDVSSTNRKRAVQASSEDPEDELEEMLENQLSDTVDWSRVRLGFI